MAFQAEGSFFAKEDSHLLSGRSWEIALAKPWAAPSEFLGGDGDGSSQGTGQNRAVGHIRAETRDRSLEEKSPVQGSSKTHRLFSFPPEPSRICYSGHFLCICKF